jgi:alkyl hydroperoxide reductase subunit AhpC
MSAGAESSAPFVSAIQVGQEVPDFRLETYNPRTEVFDEIRLAELRERKKWTILFFYPADFTFV